MSEFKAPFELRCPIHGEALVLQRSVTGTSCWYRCKDKGDHPCVWGPSASTPLAAFVAALRVGNFLIPASVQPPSDTGRWVERGKEWYPTFGRLAFFTHPVGYYLRPDEQADEALVTRWVEERIG